MDVLGWDVLGLGRFGVATFWGLDVLRLERLDVFFWGHSGLGRFDAHTFCIWNFCSWTFCRSIEN